MYNLSESQNEILKKLKERDLKLQFRIDTNTKVIAYVRGNLSEPYDRKILKKDPFQIGKQFLKDYKELFGNFDMENDLINGKMVIDNIGLIHIDFKQQHQKIQVYGGSVRVHFSKNGSISLVTCKLVPNLKLSIKAKVTAKEATKIAINHLGEEIDIIEGEIPELIIYPGNKGFRLCWHIKFDGIKQPKPSAWVYFIDAEIGSFVHRFNNLQSAGPTIGSGEGCYSGSGELNTYQLNAHNYHLRDTTRSVWISFYGRSGPEIITNDYAGASPSEDSDNKWEDLSTVPRNNNQGAEVDAHRYAGSAVNYFHNKHQQNSYDQSGANIIINVHFLAANPNTGQPDPNYGFWYPPTQQIYLGDGDNVNFNYLCSDDWLAHELTHAYTEHRCELIYDGESGALNESISDCFAAFITGCNWLIFERSWLKLTAPAERNMKNPTNDGLYDPNNGYNSVLAGHQPDHYDDKFTGIENNGGVHINCGIINHVIYLMTEGGTHRTSGVTVIGIGQAPVEKLLFDVINDNLLSDTANFLEFREGMLTSCLEAFPQDLEKLSSVKAAFKAVGIGPDLFLRDTLSDIGLEPNPSGLSYWSPDIITRTSLPADAQTEFADPTRDDLSENIEYG